MVKPNEKGGEWERSVSRALSRWVSDYRLDDVYWRSAMSGGRATLARKVGDMSRSAHAGDIVANREEGMPFLSAFVVECKAYKIFSLDAHFVHGQKDVADVIIHKPWQEAQDFKKEPFVVLKMNHKAPIVATTSRGFSILSAGATSDEDLPLLAFYPAADVHVVKFSDITVNLKYALVEEAIKSSRKRKAPSLR